MKKHAQTVAYAFFMIIFLFVGGIGFMPMMAETHHHEPGCPFMPGEYSVCLMTPFDHVAAWQGMFATIVPDTSMAIFGMMFLGLILVVLWKPPDIARRISGASTGYDSHLLLYQELFSRGILNPKAP